MKKLLSILIRRFKSKSPKGYKALAIGAGILGVAAMVAPSLPITLPVVVVGLLPLIQSLSGIVLTASLFTTEDEEIKKETKDILKK